jgi:hypothetical protein
MGEGVQHKKLRGVGQGQHKSQGGVNQHKKLGCQGEGAPGGGVQHKQLLCLQI